jgi:ketosteroid isomerase-like protein
VPHDILLSERLRVRETIERYFFGVDAQDEQALISCFTDDASAEYHLRTPEHKIVSGGRAIARDVYASCSQFASSNHSVSNFVVDIASDVANSNTFAVAHVVVRGKALLRGLRYQDRLVRDLDGWRVARRLHTPLWQIEADVLPPAFAQALSSRE